MNTASGSDDPRDYLVDQGFENYTSADHDTWRTLSRRQREILKGRIAETVARKILEGVTTTEEVLRVTMSD